MYLHSYRPKLGRIVKLVDKLKLISIFELCRLANLRFLISNNELNPKLLRLLQELKLLRIGLQGAFLVSSSLDPNFASGLIRSAEEKFEEEANLLCIAREYFLKKSLANKITLYRNPSHESLLNKFDAIGQCGWRKTATIVIECNTRRPVSIEDMIGYRERVHSTISRRRLSKPVFCYMLAKAFSDDAVGFALEKGIRLVRVDQNFSFYDIRNSGSAKPSGGTRKYEKRLRGRLAEAQGRAFEMAVERVFKRKRFETETRKNFYFVGDRITELKTKRRFTDIDVFALKEEKEAFLVDCKSGKKQVSRSELVRLIKKHERITNHLRENGLEVSSIIIGNFNELDMADAERRKNIRVTLITPYEFYQQNKEYLEGEPEWLFSPPFKASEVPVERGLKIIESRL